MRISDVTVRSHCRDSRDMVLGCITLVAALAPPQALPRRSLEALDRGRLVVVDNWLPLETVTRLRADAVNLREAGAFTASGLSNTAKGDKAAQRFGLSDRSVCAITPTLGGDLAARADVCEKTKRD